MNIEIQAWRYSSNPDFRDDDRTETIPEVCKQAKVEVIPWDPKCLARPALTGLALFLALNGPDEVLLKYYRLQPERVY